MKITLAPKPEKKPMNEDLELEEPARDTKPHRSYSQLSMYLRCSMQMGTASDVV